MKQEILRIQNGKKTSGEISCIYDLTLQVFRDEICGLIVENNVERSCLINILSGEQRLDYGWVYFLEKKLEWFRYEKTLREDICIINRKERCVSRLKVKDNIFVLKKGIAWVTPLKRLYRNVDAFFDELQCDIDPDAYVESLLPHQQKEVELLQAFVSGKKLVILSEMDEFFTEESASHLFALILKLKERGMDFLIISNNTRVLCEYSSYIYIFSRGRIRHRILKKAFNATEIHSILIKENMANDETPCGKSSGTAALVFSEVITDWGAEIDMTVHEGEIVTFVDMDIVDWALPAYLLEGREPIKSGKIFVGGNQYRPRMAGSAYGGGIGVIAENSHQIEYFSNDTVLDYITIVMSLKGGVFGFSQGHVDSLRQELLSSGDFTDEELFTPLYMARSDTIQKAAYYRWILYRPKVLICMRPFSSSDYNIQKLTRRLMRLAVERGIAVLILTMSIYETCMIGERVIAMKSGKTYEVDPGKSLEYQKYDHKTENITPFTENMKCCKDAEENKICPSGKTQKS